MLPQPTFLYFDSRTDQLFFGYPDNTSHVRLQPVATTIRKSGFKVAAVEVRDLLFEAPTGRTTGVLVAHKRLHGRDDMQAALRSLHEILQPQLATLLSTRAELLLCTCGTIDATHTKMPQFLPYFGLEDPGLFYRKYIAGLQAIDVGGTMRGQTTPAPLLACVYEVLRSLDVFSCKIEVNYNRLTGQCKHRR